MNCTYPWTGAIKLFDDKSYNELDKSYSLLPTMDDNILHYLLI